MEIGSRFKELTYDAAMHSWATTRKRGLRLGALLCVPILIVMFFDPYRETPFGTISLMILLVALAQAAINPMIILAVTTSLIQREAASEDFRLLRRTGTEPTEIAEGYLSIATYNLRSLWTESIALLLVAMLATAHLLMRNAQGFILCLGGRHGAGLCSTPVNTPFDTTFVGIPLALLGIGLAAALLIPIYLAAMSGGVYIGLRLRDNAANIATLMLGPMLGLIGGMIWVAYRLPEVGWLLVVIAIVVLSFACIYLGKALTRRIERYVRDRAATLPDQIVIDPLGFKR